jgi:uroporphyrinogen decarboxylase
MLEDLVVRPEGWKPDFERFRRAMVTKEPGPVPVGDLFADPGIINAFLKERTKSSPRWTGRLEDSSGELGPEVPEEGVTYLKKSVEFYASVGWDLVTVHGLLNFSGIPMVTAKPSSSEIAGGRRVYMESESGPISGWKDFDNYSWPKSPGNINAGARILSRLVPDGMKIMVLPGGVFEWTTWLMGLVPFSYALYDQPDLVDAIIEKLSHIIYTGAKELMTIPNVGGFFIGDDMGFFNGTFVAPDVIRQKFLPHLKKMADLAHSNGKLVLLHSCGNLEAIMDDICETGIDGKHSFEDKIMPVEDAYRRWSDRIGIIGGVDLNLLALGTEKEVRKRTTDILNVCGPNGGYVLGTGNSVASYIPIRNYLAMLDEGRKWNLEYFGREY